MEHMQGESSGEEVFQGAPQVTAETHEGFILRPPPPL